MPAANAEPDARDAGLSPIDSRLKPLLDHIACELAHEYIRLMEAAAAGEQAVEAASQLDVRP